jgi:hypothetical protein
LNARRYLAVSEVARCDLTQQKERVMKKSALIIGAFTKTEHGFTGKLETLAIKATITARRTCSPGGSGRSTRRGTGSWRRRDNSVRFVGSRLPEKAKTL